MIGWKWRVVGRWNAYEDIRNLVEELLSEWEGLRRCLELLRMELMIHFTWC